MGWRPLTLCALLLLACACSADAAFSLFRKAAEVPRYEDFTSLAAYGPITAKSVLALRGAVLATAPPPAVEAAVAAAYASGGVSPPRTTTVPYGTNSTASVQRDGNNSIAVYFFNDNEAPSSTNLSALFPPLAGFVPGAAAPADLVQTWSALSPALQIAAQELMGASAVLWVACSGEGARGAGLAILCGTSAALQYPLAGVGVVTFGAPWTGFNPQYAWAFDGLVPLFYLWPFLPAAGVAPAPPLNATSAASGASAVNQLAQGLDTLIRAPGVLVGATTLPNLPPALPKGSEELGKNDVVVPPGEYDDQVDACYASFNATSLYGGNSAICWENSPKIKSLGGLAPAMTAALPAGGVPGVEAPRPAASLSGACPLIICKTRNYLDMSSVGFKVNATGPPAVFNGLPYRVLHDSKTNADAIVLWNDTKKEAIVLWKYTEESRDWLSDAVAYKTDDYVKALEATFPAALGLKEMIPDAQVHAGFYSQFASLAVTGTGPNNLTAQILDLSGGQAPLFVSHSGFSLGGALSTLSAVWYSYQWPLANFLVATQGGPKVGNDGWISLFRATVGRGYIFQFNLDSVPYSPPLPGYRTTPNPLWITSENEGAYYTILTPRPESRDSTWYDHWSEVFYVPSVFSSGPPARTPPAPSSVAVSVPQHIAAPSSLPSP